jgi:hypothetical protein
MSFSYKTEMSVFHFDPFDVSHNGHFTTADIGDIFKFLYLQQLKKIVLLNNYNTNCRREREYFKPLQIMNTTNIQSSVKPSHFTNVPGRWACNEEDENHPEGWRYLTKGWIDFPEGWKELSRSTERKDG